MSARLEELNLELQNLNTQLQELVSSAKDVVNDPDAEKELDYFINEINKTTSEISCLIT